MHDVMLAFANTVIRPRHHTIHFPLPAQALLSNFLSSHFVDLSIFLALVILSAQLSYHYVPFFLSSFALSVYLN